MQHDKIDVVILTEEGVQLPEYTSLGASGADVRALLKENFVLQPGCSTLIPTGIRFAIPPGYEIQVRPRSGLALKHQLTVLNTPGTIDADYRGELGIIMINHGKQPFTIEPGMRIAQLVLAPVIQANFVHGAQLTATERGSGGFGHSGIN